MFAYPKYNFAYFDYHHGASNRNASKDNTGERKGPPNGLQKRAGKKVGYQ